MDNFNPDSSKLNSFNIKAQPNKDKGQHVVPVAMPIT